VHPALLVLGIEAGVVGAARATGIREDKDALGSAHEGVGIGQRLVGCARFKPLAAIRQSHQSAGAAGDLSHGIGAEARDDRIERRHNRRQRAKQLQRFGLDPQRLLGVNWIARLIDHWTRALIAVLIPVAFHGARREGIVEIVSNDLAGRKIELDFGAVLDREISEAPVEQGFGGRDQLDDDTVVGGQSLLDRGEQRGQFHRQQQLAEEALLRAFKARACRRQRLTIEGLALEWIGDAGCAQRRLKVAMDDRPGIGIGVEIGDLAWGQRMFEDVILDPGIGQRAPYRRPSPSIRGRPVPSPRYRLRGCGR
jgi:hypothetical protein